MPTVVARNVAKPRSLFQLSITDLVFMTALVFASVSIGTPICKYEFYSHQTYMAFVALTLSLFGIAVGIARASREPAERWNVKIFTTLYQLVIWLLFVVAWELGAFGAFIFFAVSTPIVVWAFVRSEMRGFAGFAFEGRLCVGLALTWLGFTAVMTALNPPRRRCCCGCGTESAAIAACKTYAEAQDIYRRTDWDSDGVLEYSLTISGANSLYEKTAGQGNLTLVDAAFASAEGAPGVAQPKAGYVFKILKGQGVNAPGGQKSYVVNGNMTQGYALVACPASYDGTGRNSFLINNTGTVYQKDLGPDTAKIVNAMTEYNPSTGWVVSE